MIHSEYIEYLCVMRILTATINSVTSTECGLTSDSAAPLSMLRSFWPATGDVRGDLAVSFSCDPQAVHRLVKEALDEIQSLQVPSKVVL